MLVDVLCKKCGCAGTLDIGDMTKEQVSEYLNKDTTGFECFGHHVEFGKRSVYWTVDWGTLRDGKAMTETEFVADLISKYSVVCSSDELLDRYEVLCFSYGLCAVEDKKTGERYALSFTHSPKGTRYYYRKGDEQNGKV